MKFTAQEIGALPPLAWCARIDLTAGDVQAWHGAGVEADPRGLVEGAWDGPFVGRDLGACSVLAGSGLRIEGGVARCFTGSFSDVPLFSVRDGHVSHVSNSLVFALVAAGEVPDPDYPCYHLDILRAWRAGQRAGRRPLRTAGGRRLRMHLAVTIDFSASGIRERPRTCEAAWDDFASYKRMLQERLGAVFANAADPGRRRRYNPIAAVSRGYDSVATAALASSVGCIDALTLRDSRQPEPDADNGSDVARSLGLACTVRDRRDYLRLPEPPEPPFAIAPCSANVPLAACADVLAGRIFVTGVGGDSIWEKTKVDVFTGFAQAWTDVASGFGQHEFRLHVGYLTVAPAMIGALRSVAIGRIMRSEAMRPWSVGGDYDRPIPRRIAEELGVPRAAFGWRKLASGHVHLTSADDYSAAGLASLRRFMARLESGPALRRRVWRARVACRDAWWSITPAPRLRLVRSSAAQRALPFLLNGRPKHVAWEFAFTLQWSFDSLRDRYAVPVAAHAPLEVGRALSSA